MNLRKTHSSALVFLLLLGILPVVNAHPESIAWSEAGVSRDLAKQRADSLSNLRAELTLHVPAERTNAITGTVRYRGKRLPDDHPLLLDFTETPDHVTAVRLGDTDVPFTVSNEHIRVGVPPGALGHRLDVAVDFTAGELSLNRRDEFLFTLFVPDRARTVFPCFDQPDLKVKYTLAVETPADWIVTSAGPELKHDGPSNPEARRWWRFGETRPLATYQFAFVAGKFAVVERDGMRLVHREADPDKLARNLDAIFDLHRQSRDWMEAYTGVAYPYQTFDFVAIPGFPYAGMEHPGNIAYRDRFLFLPENASEDERLRRAHLITHEVAHAWFGDLVTMTWFDDVWLKEVFANFMADKMVEPMFPDVDHRLQFFLGHVPRAAAIDRSEGAHPILQNLPNLRDAGTIYGALIYHKAPIMMRELERQLGADNLKRGLKTYLTRFEHGNATWDDLIDCLTPEAPAGFDLPAWSRAWVRAAGLPVVRMDGPKARIVSGPAQRLESVRVGPEVWLPDTDGVYAR